jgi:hypothetical protein
MKKCQSTTNLIFPALANSSYGCNNITSKNRFYKGILFKGGVEFLNGVFWVISGT